MYDIIAVNPRSPLPKDSEFFTISHWTLRNESWRTLIGLLSVICPQITGREQQQLASYEGRQFVGKKAEDVLIPLRRVLLNRSQHKSFVVDGEVINADLWLWEGLESIYEMLCWNDRFVVR
jgi:hypothetical protein